MRSKPFQLSLSRVLAPMAVVAVLGLSACGGGGADGAAPSTAPAGNVIAPSASGALSSGVITGFGSVFVNGHEFATGRARFIDDDSGTSTATAQGLEVGMVVDVKPSSESTATAPEASELHIHPLVRGYVDANDATAGTLSVMGQSVQLTSATNFSDHRACALATPATCTAVTGSSGLVATTGTGSAAIPGSYVTVHGFLFGASSSSVNVVATLVSVSDVPTSTTSGVNFKVEGQVSVGATATMIGGLALDLSKASCFVAGEKTACAGAFASGQVVSAWSSASPALPATSFTASVARLDAKTALETVGATVELEGAVSAVKASPASFVVNGVTVDATALAAGSTLPAVGDMVRVVGTVAVAGESVSASSVSVLHSVRSATIGLEGDAGSVADGSSANTYTLSVLGQTLLVTSQTRLADMSMRGWDREDPAANTFNINTFKTYLSSSASQHVVVKAESDASGKLSVQSLAIVPASKVAGVAGLVDATPAVVNSKASGTPSTFSVHGIAVSADPAAVTRFQGMDGMGSVAVQAASIPAIVAGDQVIVVGTYDMGTLTVGAKLTATNRVIDIGAPGSANRDQGDF